MSRRTNTRNAFETQLNGAITASATTITLDSTSGLIQPLYLVIDPENPAKREYIRTDGISGSQLTSVTRGLAGSAAGGQAHDSGTLIRSVTTHQIFDDLFDDIDDIETDITALEAADTGHFGGTDTADHPEATPSVRGFMAAADKTKLDQLDVNKQVTGGDAHTHGGGSVEGTVRIGDIIPSGLTADSGGFLLCDGRAVSRTTYADLFAAIGTTFGVGDGTTTFNIPAMAGRMVVGKTAAGTASVLGETGGALDHTHTQPTHTHTQPTHTHSQPTHVHTGPSHTHTGPSHTHSTPAHQHPMQAHQHTVPNTVSGGTHSHGASAATNQEGSGSFNVSASSHTHSGGSHSHAVGPTDFTVSATDGAGSGTSGASGTGATGASGTGNTGSAGGDTTGASGDDTTGASGGDATGATNPPYIALNWFIRAA